MKQMLLIVTAILLSSVSLGQTPDAPADNSKINKAPGNSSVKSSTADGQSNASTDLRMTQQIRKAVIADKSLSTYGHNVKIVTVNGAVTLNGTVRSAAEESNIVAKAKSIAGDSRVTDDLKVASKN